MKTYPKLATAVIIFTALFTTLSREPKSDIRFFCSSGRVFIEFEEDGKVWGSMWLDDEGRPVSCNNEKPVMLHSTLIRDI